MLIHYNKDFLKSIRKIKDAELKERVKKHIERILEDPEIGKPMRYARKGTREVHVPPYRLAYAYEKSTQTMTFLDFYHKDGQ